MKAGEGGGRLGKRADPAVGVVLALGALSLGLLVYADVQWGRHFRESGVVLDGLVGARLSLTGAHLRLEEFLSGEPGVRAEDALRAIDEAETAIEEAIAGRNEVAGIDGAPHGDAELRHQLGGLRTAIGNFRAAARARLAEPSAAGVGTPVHRMFQDSFRKIDAAFAEALARARGSLGAALSEQRHLRRGVIGLWLAALAGSAIFLVWSGGKRRRAERALRDREEDLAATLHSIGDAVIATDLGGRVVRMNPVAEDLTGWPLPGARGRPLDDVFRIVHEETGDALASPVATVLRERRIVELENHTVLLARDGRRRAIADSGAPIRDARGELAGAVLVFRDETERRRAERRIRRLNTVLRTIRNVNQLICRQWDRDRLLARACETLVETRGYAKAWIGLLDARRNFVAARMAGRGDGVVRLAEDVTGRGMPRCAERALQQAGVHVIDDPCEFCEGCPLAQDDPRSFRAAVRLECGDRIYGILAVVLPPRMAPDDEEQALLGEVSDDIAFALHAMEEASERRRAEEDRERLEAHLRQTQRLEAIGALAGGIAHDFNNILSAMMGFTEMALSDLPEEGIARRRLKEVQRGAGRAKRLVRQILAFSRRGEQEFAPFEVAPVVGEATALMRGSLPATIEVREAIEAERAVVVGDATQIYRVVVNLCTNAAQAMREHGGVLEIGLAEIDIGADDLADYPELRPGPHLRLTVSDTGPGMAPAVLERIFEPYFTTKGPGEGTGIGLSVVYGIVRSHGGAVRATSEPGTGTSFHVLLPRYEAAAAPAEEDRGPIPTGEERILFVDDEPSLAEMAAAMLGRLGYTVTAHTGAREAAEAFRARPHAFDLVITDQTMPGMTGLELARQILRIRPDTPVILCTGFSEAVTPEAVRTMGIRELLMKPFTLRDVGEAIRRALEGSDRPDA